MTLEVNKSPGVPQRSPGELLILVDLKVFSLSAVKKTLYVLGALATAEVQLRDEFTADIHYTLRTGSPLGDDFPIRFQQELLDQDLRESISSQTEGVRNLIIAHALSRVPLINPELEIAGPN